MVGATVVDAELAEHLATYREQIGRYLLSITHDDALAEDLTQETFVRAYEKLQSLDDRASPAAWLYRIATNLFRDRFRSSNARKRTPPAEPVGDDAIESAIDPGPRLDKALEQSEMSSCVQRYLFELSDSYRAIILLHDVEGLTNPEIAEMLGISVHASKVRLHRARKRLAAALEKGCALSRDERSVLVCEPKPRSMD